MNDEIRKNLKEKPIVLVVDADIVRRFQTSVYLLRLEYHVFAVGTPEDALRIMQLTIPHIVITDIGLPGMNGYELIRQMKQDPPLRQVPVLIYVPSAIPVNGKLCEQAGCSGYLTQTGDHNELYKAVQKATEQMPRRFVRLKTWLDVTVSAPGQDMAALVTAISEEGMFVSTPLPLPFRTTAQFTIFLPKLATGGIKVTGQVLFCQSSEKSKTPGMGIRFLGLKPEVAMLIKTFVKQTLLQGIESLNRTAD
jgi:CheY-like chemotaxis protein